MGVILDDYKMITYKFRDGKYVGGFQGGHSTTMESWQPPRAVAASMGRGGAVCLDCGYSDA